jgi:hypothetical protein
MEIYSKGRLAILENILSLVMQYCLKESIELFLENQSPKKTEKTGVGTQFLLI